jgi:hypothetical protein
MKKKKKTKIMPISFHESYLVYLNKKSTFTMMMTMFVFVNVNFVFLGVDIVSMHVNFVPKIV